MKGKDGEQPHGAYDVEVGEDVVALLVKVGVKLEDVQRLAKLVCRFWMRIVAFELFGVEGVRDGLETLSRREMVLGESKIADDFTLLLVELWRWVEYEKCLGGKE